MLTVLNSSEWIVMQGEGTAGHICHMPLSQSNETASEKQGDKHQFLQPISSLRFGNLRHCPSKPQAGVEYIMLNSILLPCFGV